LDVLRGYCSVSEHEQVPPLGELKATRRDVRDRPARNPESARASKSGDSGYREYDLLLRESPPRTLAIFQQSLAILVRLLGLCFLVVGISAAIIILREAWTLYQEPVRIERFAVAIEQGSNLDKIFASNGGETAGTGEQGESVGESAGDSSAQPATSGATGDATLRLSYFAGWFLVLLLMLVASITAIAAVSAGGRLVLYDTDIRQLSRAVVKEVRRNKGGG